MMLRLCRPAAVGSFPLNNDLHGGARNEGIMAGCRVRFHDIYWSVEDAMAEGNQMLVLLRGETVAMPSTFWLQGTLNIVNDYHDPESGQPLNEPERFGELYRAAGGVIDVIRVDYETR